MQGRRRVRRQTRLHQPFTRDRCRCLNTRTRMRPSLQLVEKVGPMMSQVALFPIRMFVLATVGMLLFVSDANAYRIFHVSDSSADKSPPVVRYIYPKNFQPEETQEFIVRERNRAPVIINRIASCYCPPVQVHVTLHRHIRYRPAGIRVHRAAEFRRSRIRLHKAGHFGY